MNIIGIVTPVFGIIFLGWLTRKIGVVSKDSVSILNNFAYYVAFPALFFYSLYNTDIRALSYEIFTVNVISIFLMILTSFILTTMTKFDGKTKASIIFSSFFGNCVYMGFPLSQLSFGEESLGIASILAAIYFIIGLTIGIFIIQLYSLKKRNFTKIMYKVIKAPIFWSVVFGLIFSAFLRYLPETLLKLLSMLGNSASPVALFALGAFLYGTLEKRNIKEISLIGFLKLILLPVIVLVISISLGLKELQQSVSILEAGMPIAITTFVIAEQFKLDKKLIANSIVLTTIFSLFTIPIVLSMISIFV